VRDADSVNIMDGDPMMLSNDANKRSSWVLGESIRDQEWKRKGGWYRARLSQRLFIAGRRFPPYGRAW
jgi:hypothetical protein